MVWVKQWVALLWSISSVYVLILTYAHSISFNFHYAFLWRKAHQLYLWMNLSVKFLHIFHRTNEVMLRIEWVNRACSNRRSLVEMSWWQMPNTTNIDIFSDEEREGFNPRLRGDVVCRFSNVYRVRSIQVKPASQRAAKIYMSYRSVRVCCSLEHSNASYSQLDSLS